MGSQPRGAHLQTRRTTSLPPKNVDTDANTDAGIGVDEILLILTRIQATTTRDLAAVDVVETTQQSRLRRRGTGGIGRRGLDIPILLLPLVLLVEALYLRGLPASMRINLRRRAQHLTCLHILHSPLSLQVWLSHYLRHLSSHLYLQRDLNLLSRNHLKKSTMTTPMPPRTPLLLGKDYLQRLQI